MNFEKYNEILKQDHAFSIKARKDDTFATKIVWVIIIALFIFLVTAFWTFPIFSNIGKFVFGESSRSCPDYEYFAGNC